MILLLLRGKALFAMRRQPKQIFTTLILSQLLSLRGVIYLLFLLFATPIFAEDYDDDAFVDGDVNDGMVVFEDIVVTVTGNITVTGGTIDIKPGGTLIILSGFTLTTDQDIVNDNGTITINGAIITTGSKVENKAGGVINGSGTISYPVGTQILNNDSSSFFGYTGDDPTGPDGPCSGGAGTCANAALPVVLTFFNAKYDEGRVALEWATSTEMNNASFNVERSEDGREWTPILEVEGAGNSTEETQYSVFDLHPHPGKNFYRLKQTDYDGSSDYSSIVFIHVDQHEDFDVTVFPNPTKERLVINSQAFEIDELRIHNLLGENVTSQVIIINNSKETKILDLSNLHTGIYLLTLPNTSLKIYKY